MSTPQWDNNQTYTTVTTPYIHHITFWCTGGCRDKLYTTPPITRWIYVTVVTVETSQQGKTPPGSVYSYIQIRMARFLALWFVTVFTLLPFNLILLLLAVFCIYLWTSTYTHRVFVFSIYQNIVLPCHNVDFPFSDHHTFSRKFTGNFPKIFRKFLGKFLHPSPTPLTHPPYHSPTPNTRTCEPTQNFKFNFLNYIFIV